MIAKRIPTIMPSLSFEECLEVTQIHSIAGKLSESTPIVTSRPFRAPHHTVTTASLIGGGAYPKPGEISLAHYGVLFLDELPEFNRNALEVLRGPIEDGNVVISRSAQVVTYPCRFMLVASMNPCPCGYFGSEKECTCSDYAVKRYLSKISGPLLDRIDVQVEVNPVKYQNITSKNAEEKSESIRQRVNKARKIQQERYKDLHINSNSELTPKMIEKYCVLSSQAKEILDDAFNKLKLSARAYDRILKVARTIADLENSQNIETKHILEAIQYRSLDKKINKMIGG